MLYMMYMMLIILMITKLFFIMNNMLAKKSFYDHEKLSPFECGFDPKNSSRLPFSLKFFLIAIIFLIFDIEIILLFPLIITMNYSSMLIWMITITFFIMILLIGLYHEWAQGMLNWTN